METGVQKDQGRQGIGSEQGLASMQGPNVPLLAPVPDLKHTQELLVGLLNKPVSEWKMETLLDGLMAISQKFVEPIDRPSNYQMIAALEAKRKDLQRENNPVGRVLGMISHGLREGEEQFRTLVTYNGYRGDELTQRSQSLYASTVLSALSISATKTGEFGYLRNLLVSENPSIVLAAHTHVTDLDREMGDIKGTARFDEFRKSLGTEVKQGLKSAVERDLSLLASELKLSPYLQSRLTECLNERPRELPEMLKRELKSYGHGNGRDPVQLFSDILDQRVQDIRTYRGLAVQFAAPGPYMTGKLPLLELYGVLAA